MTKLSFSLSLCRKNEIEVINLKKAGPEALKDPGTVYIGRQITGWRGHYIHASPLANKSKVGRDGTAEEVCQIYENDQLKPELDSGMGPMFDEIIRLRGMHQKGQLKCVACWCVEEGKNKPCHGFSVVKAIKGEL